MLDLLVSLLVELLSVVLYIPLPPVHPPPHTWSCCLLYYIYRSHQYTLHPIRGVAVCCIIYTAPTSTPSTPYVELLSVVLYIPLPPVHPPPHTWSCCLLYYIYRSHQYTLHPIRGVAVCCIIYTAPTGTPSTPYVELLSVVLYIPLPPVHPPPHTWSCCLLYYIYRSHQYTLHPIRGVAVCCIIYTAPTGTPSTPYVELLSVVLYIPLPPVHPPPHTWSCCLLYYIYRSHRYTLHPIRGVAVCCIIYTPPTSTPSTPYVELLSVVLYIPLPPVHPPPHTWSCCLLYYIYPSHQYTLHPIRGVAVCCIIYTPPTSTPSTPYVELLSVVLYIPLPPVHPPPHTWSCCLLYYIYPSHRYTLHPIRGVAVCCIIYTPPTSTPSTPYLELLSVVLYIPLPPVHPPPHTWSCCLLYYIYPSHQYTLHPIRGVAVCCIYIPLPPVLHPTCLLYYIYPSHRYTLHPIRGVAVCCIIYTPPTSTPSTPYVELLSVVLYIPLPPVHPPPHTWSCCLLYYIYPSHQYTLHPIRGVAVCCIIYTPPTSTPSTPYPEGMLKS